MTRVIWVAVGIIFAARAIGAFFLPLTGDEAYYWEWSRRLAAGYVDHPPAVAWTIWLFGHFAASPGLVRLGFVLNGAIATGALAACATQIGRDKRAGAVAALVFSITPLASIAFGSAGPDGPYLMFWCLGLWFAARAFEYRERRDFILLGLALGGVMLSRVFGFALVAGILAYALLPQQRPVWRAGLWVSLGISLVVYSPFLIWNAENDWVTFAFSLIHRHEGEGMQFSLVDRLHHLLSLEATQAAAYSPGIWIAALVLAIRPRSALLAWTAVPLMAFLTIFVLFRDVEIHWVIGPFASICAMMGIAYVEVSHRLKIIWTTTTVVPALVLLPAIFAMTFAPGPSYAIVQRETSLKLKNAGPFEIFAYKPLAKDVAVLARDHHAIVMTDGYGLSSVIDFDADVQPVVIGYDWQGRESRAWYPSTNHPRKALFVDKEPLSTRSDFTVHLARACGRVVDGGVREYKYEGAPPRKFYLTWCERLRPDAIAILRWEREPHRT